jgi:hypothetical protein
MVAGLALVELAFTAMIATLPVLTRERFDAGAGLAGLLLASYGAGSVAGGLLSSRARSADDRVAMLAIAGIAISTWPLLASLPSYGVALAVAANGVCSGLFFPRFFAAVTLTRGAARPCKRGCHNSHLRNRTHWIRRSRLAPRARVRDDGLRACRSLGERRRRCRHRGVNGTVEYERSTKGAVTRCTSEEVA